MWISTNGYRIHIRSTVGPVLPSAATYIAPRAVKIGLSPDAVCDSKVAFLLNGITIRKQSLKLARNSLGPCRTEIARTAITFHKRSGRRDIRSNRLNRSCGRYYNQKTAFNPGLGSHIMTRTTRGRQESSASQTSSTSVAEPVRHVAQNGQARKNGHDTQSQPEIRALLHGLQAMRSGDFSVRLPGDWIGLEGKIADTFNDIVAANQHMARELQRVGHVVGKEGKTRERAHFARSNGAWGEMEVSVNTLVDDLLRPTTEVTGAIAAVAQGDLRQTVRLDVDGRPLEGEFLRSAMIVNTMIQQLGVFTSEVTRVAREVGTDGKLGGQAQAPAVG